MLSQSYSEHRYLLSISLHPSWSFYFFPLLHWTVTGTDGLVCCVMVYFFFSPHISCALWNTVGAGIRLSVLPVLPLTCLGNCFTGGCQIKKYPIWERQRQPVNICPPCLFCPLMWSSCLCLSLHPIKGRDALCHRTPGSSADFYGFVLFVNDFVGFQVLTGSPFWPLSPLLFFSSTIVINYVYIFLKNVCF